VTTEKAITMLSYRLRPVEDFCPVPGRAGANVAVSPRANSPKNNDSEIVLSSHLRNVLRRFGAMGPSRRFNPSAMAEDGATWVFGRDGFTCPTYRSARWRHRNLGRTRYRSGLVCFSDTVKGPIKSMFFLVLLPDGTVVVPSVAKSL
jgi:hypothetical protein